MQGYLSKDWAIIQNVYNGSDDILDEQVGCMEKIVKSIWKYSISMWKARCEDIHGVMDGKTGSKRRRELMQLIDKEIKITHYFGDYEIRQLRRNIIKSKGNANTASLETWLSMIRKVKESTIMLKRETRLTTARMQLITRFLCRAAPA